jgi:hypothetical protein
LAEFACACWRHASGTGGGADNARSLADADCAPQQVPPPQRAAWAA